MRTKGVQANEFEQEVIYSPLNGLPDFLFDSLVIRMLV